MRLQTSKLFTTLLLASVLGFVGCSSSKKNAASDAEPVSSLSGDGLTLELNGDSDSSTAGGLSTVYFAFDSSSISSQTRAELDANASYLKTNNKIDIQVEGHADERGGIQYNLALGERRAKAVKDYLVASGVKGNRITIVSYGKEKPVSFGHDETSWSRNRRANFVITAK